MSKFLSSVASIEFDSMVKHAYQGVGKMRSSVTQRSGVVGDTYKWRLMGRGLANQKASQADVTPMDVSHNLITTLLENWNAPEYTDIFDQAEVNFDEKSELAKTIAMAMGRREDQLIFNAMGNIEAAAGAQHSPVAVGGVGMTVEKIRIAGAAFDGVGMSNEGRCIAWNKTQKQQLLDSTLATSGDFVSVQSLVSGQIDHFYGFSFKLIDDRIEGGLPGGGTADATAYAYHTDAVGLATGIDVKTEINYIAQKTSWLCNGLLKAGSSVRDAGGVIEIHSDDTA